MRGIIRNTLSILFAIIIVTVLTKNLGPWTKPIPEKILDTIVTVERSSGVIVDSTDTHALILTAYHVVSPLVNPDGTLKNKDKPVTISFAFFSKPKREALLLRIFYYSKKIYIQKDEDLALIEIEVDGNLYYSKLGTQDPKLAEEVFVAGNPNFNYRSISKGIISSKDRYVSEMHVWQISGGVIFGQSGGGAFNADGELMAIAKSVDLYFTGFCVTDEESDETNCLKSAIPYIGYFVPRHAIKKFLLSTEFKDRFEYLK